MDAKISDQISQISEKWFDNVFQVVGNVYFDLEMLQDFRLGALMLMSTTDTELKYINSRLTAYDKRYNEDTVKYFPVLSKTNEQIDEFIVDPDNQRTLAAISPMNNFYKELPNFFHYILENNQRCKSMEMINIHIGTNSLTYPQDLKANIVNQIKSFNPLLTVTIYNRPLMQLDYADIQSMDMVFFNDLSIHVNNETFKEIIISRMEYASKRIFTYPVISEEIQEGESPEALLHNFKAVFGVFAEFEYIRRGVEIN